MENKQTAVEFLVDKLEKQQIINAHLTGNIFTLEMEATKQATEYYFETYKKPTEWEH